MDCLLKDYFIRLCSLYLSDLYEDVKPSVFGMSQNFCRAAALIFRACDSRERSDVVVALLTVKMNLIYFGLTSGRLSLIH